MPGGAKVMRILGPIILGFCLILAMFVGFYWDSYKKKKIRRGMGRSEEEELTGRQKKRSYPGRMQENTRKIRKLEVNDEEPENTVKSVKMPLRHTRPRRPRQQQSRPWTALVVANTRRNGSKVRQNKFTSDHENV